MPITIKNTAAGKQAPVQRNIASLVGGCVIAAGSFILWLLVASQLTQATLTIPLIIAGAAIAAAIGVWIRMADL
jgi:hypothetical protein